MRLRIDDNCIGGSNYEYKLCVNNETALLIPDEDIYEIEAADGEEICIIGNNVYAGGFKRLFLGFFVWLISLLGGTSDVDMFGYPFHMKFFFKKCGDGEIIFERSISKGIGVKAVGLTDFRYEIGYTKNRLLRWIALAIVPFTILWLFILYVAFAVFFNASGYEVLGGIIIVFLLVLGLSYYVRTFSAFKGMKKLEYKE